MVKNVAIFTVHFTVCTSAEEASGAEIQIYCSNGRFVSVTHYNLLTNHNRLGLLTN